MYETILQRQIKLIETSHSDWEKDRVRGLAEVWARRAFRMFWEAKPHKEPQNPTPKTSEQYVKPAGCAGERHDDTSN